MNDHVTISLYKILKKFPDNEAARKFLERKRWGGDTPTCPFCGSTHSVARTGKKLGFYRCNHCRYTKNVGPRGGVWGENEGVLPSFAVFVAGKTSFFVIFFLKRTIDVPNKDPLNRPRVRVPPS